jgi:hypothetical protein
MYELKVLNQVNDCIATLLGEWVNTYPGTKIVCNECKKYHEYKTNSTVIPTLYEFDRGWLRSGVENPLYYRWVYEASFDDNYEKYVKEVDEILTKQVELWGVDEITRNHKLFKCFKLFSDAVSLLTIFIKD